MFTSYVATKVKWGGTHRFHDAAIPEAKHRQSLKSHGKKIRVRTDTQTENDLLNVTKEELVFDTMQDLLDADTEERDESAVSDDQVTASVSVKLIVTTMTRVHGSRRDKLVHEEVLVSWGEMLDMFLHCFPAVGQHVQNGETTWQIGQHCSHDNCGTRYHYWGTDTAYPHASRHGIRRRRDMVHVTGLAGEHLAEIVCFVKAILPSTSSTDLSAPRPEVVGVLVRWLTPHSTAIYHDGEPTCPGPLCHTHNLWDWHKVNTRREAISGYRYGRLSAEQKKWLQPDSKREELLFASYDVIEIESIGKYANVTPDFCTGGFLQSVSWA